MFDACSMGGMAAEGVDYPLTLAFCRAFLYIHNPTFVCVCFFYPACSMGGTAAEGVGYGIAYVYVEGLV